MHKSLNSNTSTMTEALEPTGSCRIYLLDTGFRTWLRTEFGLWLYYACNNHKKTEDLLIGNNTKSLHVLSTSISKTFQMKFHQVS